MKSSRLIFIGWVWIAMSIVTTFAPGSTLITLVLIANANIFFVGATLIDVIKED